MTKIKTTRSKIILLYTFCIILFIFFLVINLFFLKRNESLYAEIKDMNDNMQSITNANVILHDEIEENRDAMVIMLDNCQNLYSEIEKLSEEFNNGINIMYDEYGVKQNENLNTVLATNDKLLFVTNKGDLAVRESNSKFMMDYREKGQTTRIISGVSDVRGLSCDQSGKNDTIYVIKNDGTLLRMFINSDADNYLFEKVEGIENCVKVCVSYEHTIALTSDGKVYTWGGNSRGQLGNGTNEHRAGPMIVQGLNGIVDIATGMYHSIALSANGMIYTWGANHRGQLGNNQEQVNESLNIGEKYDLYHPYQVETINDIVQIGAIDDFSYALRKDGIVYEWGGFDDARPGFFKPLPVQMEILQDIKKISTCRNSGLALSSNGEVWMWGRINTGKVDGGPESPQKTAEVQDVKDIIAGNVDLFITKDNEIWQGFTDLTFFINASVEKVVSNKDIYNMYK